MIVRSIRKREIASEIIAERLIARRTNNFQGIFSGFLNVGRSNEQSKEVEQSQEVEEPPPKSRSRSRRRSRGKTKKSDNIRTKKIDPTILIARDGDGIERRLARRDSPFRTQHWVRDFMRCIADSTRYGGKPEKAPRAVKTITEAELEFLRKYPKHLNAYKTVLDFSGRLFARPEDFLPDSEESTDQGVHGATSEVSGEQALVELRRLHKMLRQESEAAETVTGPTHAEVLAMLSNSLEVRVEPLERLDEEEELEEVKKDNKGWKEALASATAASAVESQVAQGVDPEEQRSGRDPLVEMFSRYLEHRYKDLDLLEQAVPLEQDQNQVQEPNTRRAALGRTRAARPQMPMPDPWQWPHTVMALAEVTEQSLDQSLDVPLVKFTSRGLRYRLQRFGSTVQQPTVRSSPPPVPSVTSRVSPIVQQLAPADKFSHMTKTVPVERKVTRGTDKTKPPRLLHGLDAVLASPGVHPMRDLITNRLNFPPYLERLHPTEIIDYSSIGRFVTSSQDMTLAALTARSQCRYQGSTSSVTSILAHIYFALSRFKPCNLSMLSDPFASMLSTFTKATRKPVALCLRPMENGVYSIDSQSLERIPSNLVLIDLGKSMEKMLTMSPGDFVGKLVKQRPGSPIAPPAPYDEGPSTYNYMKVEDMLLRSQIDCYDPMLPYTSQCFDLKSRAAFPIRYNILNYRDHLSYAITELVGTMRSYEREFYDMIRSCFIKYALQLRIGDMNGAFVTYHNTDRVFGFEYLPLHEIDRCVFGSSGLAEASFSLTCRILIDILNTLTSRWRGGTLRVFACANYMRPEVELFVQEVKNDLGWSDFDEVELLNAPVSKFVVRVESLVNGVHQMGPLRYEDGDRVEAYHSIEEVPISPKEFMQILNRTSMRL